MVDLLTPSTTADGDTASDGLAQQKGRTGMKRRVTRRTATITIVSTLLLALLTTAGVARVFSLAPLTRQEQTTRQDLNGDAGVATSGSAARDALTFLLLDAAQPNSTPASFPPGLPSTGAGALTPMPWRPVVLLGLLSATALTTVATSRQRARRRA